ncbi:hypothetical protein YB2330_002078 [Saitoella coloradoensis]
MCLTDANLAVEREVLPNWVKPSHYDLNLYNFDFAGERGFTYDGAVTIKLDIAEATDKILINVVELKLTKASIVIAVQKTEQQVNATDITLDETKQVATLKFPDKLSQGAQADLRIEFQGVLNDKMSGFYRSKYELDGKTQYMFSTQFEATDARRAFPCFDEPALKATFDCTVTVPDELTALGNMPVKSEKPAKDGKKGGEKGPGPEGAEGLKIVEFERTPVMSTYLLAFVIAKMEYVEAHSTDPNIPVRVYTTPGFSSSANVALNAATKIIDYFSSVFDIPYALPKCDLVAVPEFAMGAMENWGLITYRTTAVLFDEGKSDEKYRQRVVYVVAHELAHQWFGNLVTMEFWDELWLNEGFATWMGWLAVDHLEPSWKVWDQFVSSSLQTALHLDSLRGSHPIEVPVRDALQINQIFDAISYQKGASSIRMLASHVGVDAFLKGVSSYLKKHSYSNAHTADLWSAISEKSGMDVGGFMNNWIKKIGYPVLDIVDKEDGTTITQRRFLSSGDVKPEEDETVWWVPLALRVGASGISSLSKEDIEKITALTEKETTLPMLKKGEFFKFNADQVGVYRVNYSPERLAALGEVAAKDQSLLSPSDRVGLVADAALMGISGFGSTTGLLELVSQLKGEENYVVWEQVCMRLSGLKSAWFEQSEEVQAALKKLTRELTGPKAKELGFEYPSKGESFLTSQLRTLLISVAGHAGDEEIVAEARKRFDAFVNGDESTIHPNLRRAVYGIVLSQGGSAADFDAVLNIYRNAPTDDAKENALAALGEIQDIELINKLLGMMLAGEFPIQDIHTPTGTLAANYVGRERQWECIKDNWTRITQSFGANPVVLNRFVPAAVNKFSSEEAGEDIRKFFEDKDCNAFSKALGQSLDAISAHASWVKRDAGAVEIWLDDHNYL